MPVYETRTTTGGSSMTMLGIFLVSCLIIALAVILIMHAAMHIF
jgi:hypothetical protein